MTNKVDWKVSADAEHVKAKAIELRRIVAERIYLAPFQSENRAAGFLKSPRTHWRKRAIEKAELYLGRAFSGTILEIGAGTAWCSALMSQKPDVKMVYALDYDAYSVDEIMPLAFQNLGANLSKLTRALGSFNKVGLKDQSVDVIISIGAIHHSESLSATFDEAFRVMKPGAILVASEPCVSDALSNEEQLAMDNMQLEKSTVQTLYGDLEKDVSESDNSDHTYRLVDYLSAGLASKFNVFPYTFDTEHSMAADENPDEFFTQHKCYNGFQKIVIPPYFAKNNTNNEPIFDPLLLILQKPHN